MEGEVKHNCGVLGFCLNDDSEDSILVPELGKRGLSAIQNRGQDGAGAYSLKKKKGKYGKTFENVKDVSATVYQLFGGDNEERKCKIYEKLKGIAFLAHVRYGTSGDRRGSAQPGYRRHGRRGKRFVFGWNGNLANAPELEDKVLSNFGDYDLESDIDTELIMHLVSKKLKRLYEEFDLGKGKKPDFFDVAKECVPEMDGAYNLVFMFPDGKIGAIRDPWGFRDLLYGENNQIKAVASESTALIKMGIPQESIKRMPKGGVLVMDKNQIEVREMFSDKRESLCFFEGEYVANVSSSLGGVPIYFIRERGGDELYRAETPEHLSHIEKNKSRVFVVPAPDTANDSASQYAYKLGVPLRRGILKVFTPDQPKRGFINPLGKREKIIEERYFVIPEIFNNNIIHLVEDSTVRGDTLKKLVEYIKLQTNVDEIHIRVTTPPIIAPCFYAIDMSSFGELIANQFSETGSIIFLEKKLVEYFKVDSFRYMTHSGLDNMFGGSLKGRLCKACITGEYPTDYGMKRAIEAKERWEKLKRKGVGFDFQI